ncbi:hypothetical protein KL936_000261 [Ogataea polymorpha]|nr:hypothetical protein KL936_000261 [Ogataea polymorpha]
MTDKKELKKKEPFLDVEAGQQTPDILQKPVRDYQWLRNPIVIVLQILILGLFCRFTLDQVHRSAQPDPVHKTFVGYLGSLEENYAGKWLKEYSNETQFPGTEANIKLANWTRDKFLEFGLEVETDLYTTYISYPVSQSLDLLSASNGSVVFKAALQEDILEEDPTSLKSVPAFLGYAASGDVVGEYIYCNYGTKEDFDTLAELGVNATDKIAVIRYGKIFRGLKVKFAQDFGFKAALLFTDPKDDGEVTEANGYKAYPEGIARNPSAIQRGSSQFLSVFPGDPTTPGYAIKPGENKTRSSPHLTTPRIPAIPVSYREVIPILQKLSGHGPKVESWPAGLVPGYDYASIGPNPNYKLHLTNEQDFNITNLYNVYGKIEGHKKDEVIIIGNHRDSWTPAAGDPHTGSAVLLEIARALGNLQKTGWKPQRTIMLASWDGEEYGLLGSTEFGEYNAHDLSKKTLAYFNMDVSAVGNILELGASPMLYEVLRSTADLLEYPGTDKTLYDHFKENTNDTFKSLGSGSDYTVFLDHLGIPSVDMGFTSNRTGPVYHYHSVYDSYHWIESLADPGFVFHNLMAKYVGLSVLKLSETKVYQMKASDYASEIQRLYEKVEVPKNWLSRTRGHCSKGGKLVDLLSDTEQNIISLKKAAISFDEEAVQLQTKYDNWDSLSWWEKLALQWKIVKTNHKLNYFERKFLNPDGLKDRPWFRHIIYVSGRYTGYAGQQLPGLVEPIEDNDYETFVRGLTFFNNVVNNLATSI